jgi:hypothetical protein
MLTLIRRANVIRIRLERFLVRPHLSAWVFFVILSLVMLYPLSLHLNDAAVDKADPLLNAWILAWDARALTRQPGALFDANIFYPYSRTLAYSETLLGLVPFAAPIIWLTGNPLLAVNVLCLLSFVLCGWGMFALVYRLTREWWAALIAGVIFAYVPYRFAHVSRLQLVTAQWIPLAFLFLDRLVERKAWRDWALLALVFNLQMLSSYYYGLFASVSLAVLLIGYWLTQRRSFDRKFVVQLLALGLITLAVNAPFVLPYFTVARDMNFQRSLEDAVRGGADLMDFVTVPPENWLYGSLTSAWRQGWWYEHVSFPGLLACALGMMGLVSGMSRRARTRPVIHYGLLLLAAFVLMLGPALRWRGQTVLTPMPYTLLYEFVPGFRGLRQPARFSIIAVLALSVLAGYGFIWLARRVPERWARNRLAPRSVLGALAAGIVMMEYTSVPVPFVTVPTGDQIPAVYRWLAQQAGEFSVLELPLRTDLRETEGPRLYFSTFHWKRLVNGYSGWHTPVYTKLLGYTGKFPDEPSLRWIVGIGVQYVIVHRAQLTPEELAWLDAQVGKYADGLALAQSFGDDQVYQVLQPLTGAPTARGWRVGPAIAWLGYWTFPTKVQAGQEMALRFFWQRRGDITQDYVVRTDVLDHTGRVVLQRAEAPVYGTRATSTWQPDEVIMDRHDIQLPLDLPAGQYEIRAGLFLSSTHESLPISTLEGAPVGELLSLGRLTVTGAGSEK